MYRFISKWSKSWKKVTWNDDGSPITLHVTFISSLHIIDKESGLILYDPPNIDNTVFYQHVTERCAEAQGFYPLKLIGENFESQRVYLHKSKFPKEFDFTFKDFLNHNAQLGWKDLNTHGELHLIDRQNSRKLYKSIFLFAPVNITREGREFMHHKIVMKQIKNTTLFVLTRDEII